MSVKFDVIGGSPAQVRMVADAQVILDDLIPSGNFALSVLAYDYTELGGKTKAQLLNDLRTEMRVKVIFYDGYFWSRVVGYTRYLFDSKIFLNQDYIDTVPEACSTLMHEFCHVLGYAHKKVFATSVPYMMNQIVEKLVRPAR